MTSMEIDESTDLHVQTTGRIEMTRPHEEIKNHSHVSGANEVQPHDVVMQPRVQPYVIGLFIGTSGNSLSQNAMIGLTGCVVRVSDKKIISTFGVEINMPEDRMWGADILRKIWHVTDEKWLEFEDRINSKLATPPDLAMALFVTWLRMDVFKDIAKCDATALYFAVESTSYDCMWINYYLDKYLDERPLHMFWDNNYRDVLNINSVSFGISKLKLQDSYVFEKIDGSVNYIVKAKEILNLPLSSSPAIIPLTTSSTLIKAKIVFDDDEERKLSESDESSDQTRRQLQGPHELVIDLINMTEANSISGLHPREPWLRFYVKNKVN